MFIKKIKFCFYILAIHIIIFANILWIYVIPLVDKEFQVPLKNLAIIAKNRLQPDEELIYFGVGDGNIFYVGKKVIILDNEYQYGNYLLNQLISARKYYVITTYPLYRKIKDFISVNLVKKEGNYVLFKNF